MNVIEQVSESFGYSSVVMPSGAGHDAQDMAIIAPTAMIFVQVRMESVTLQRNILILI